MNSWNNISKLLVVRLDNMGDLIMSSPAIRALKNSFQCSVTLLTSSLAQGIVPYLDCIDDCIVCDVPWVKTGQENVTHSFYQVIERLKNEKFDAAVIFTVFSQNPLPAAMLTMLAGIPRRLAYCRENPYALLTTWIPEQEPYSFVRHQVKRDLDMVGQVGAYGNDDLLLKLPETSPTLLQKLTRRGIDVNTPWILFHPGVSEKKRAYPLSQWKICAQKIIVQLKYPILVSGTANEKHLADELQSVNPEYIFSLAGDLSLEEFIMLIKMSSLVISVNTATVHIAAAAKTKVVVLYALTNPQHAPWKAVGKVLTYPVPEELQSKNEVLRFVHNRYYIQQADTASPEQIVEAAVDLLQASAQPAIDELVV